MEEGLQQELELNEATLRATQGVWGSEWQVCEEAKEEGQGRWGQRWGVPQDSRSTTPVNQLPWVLSFYPAPWGETVIGKQLQGWDLGLGRRGRGRLLGGRGVARLARQTLLGKPGNSLKASSSNSRLGHQGSLSRLTRRPKWKRGRSELLLSLVPHPLSSEKSPQPDSLSESQHCQSVAHLFQSLSLG